MKYNLKLSRPQAQQLKDVMQKTSFERIDNKWRFFARVLTIDKAGNNVNLNVGDCVFCYTKWNNISIDANNKVIVIDLMVKENNGTNYTRVATGLSQNLINLDDDIQHASDDYPNVGNLSAWKGVANEDFKPSLHAKITAMNGDMSCVENFTFSNIANREFAFCTIELIGEWFVGNTITKPIGVYQITTHRTEPTETGGRGYETRFYVRNIPTYSGTINGIGYSQIITCTEAEGCIRPTDNFSDSAYFAIAGRGVGGTPTKIEDGTTITSLSPNVQSIEAGDYLSENGVYCGDGSGEFAKYEEGEFTESGVTYDYFQETIDYCSQQVNSAARYRCIKVFNNGLSLYRGATFSPNWELADFGSGGGGGGVAHQVNVAHSGYIGSYTIANNISLSASGNTLTLSFDTRTMTEEQITYLSNS